MLSLAALIAVGCGGQKQLLKDLKPRLIFLVPARSIRVQKSILGRMLTR